MKGLTPNERQYLYHFHKEMLLRLRTGNRLAGFVDDMICTAFGHKWYFTGTVEEPHEHDDPTGAKWPRMMCMRCGFTHRELEFWELSVKNWKDDQPRYYNG